MRLPNESGIVPLSWLPLSHLRTEARVTRGRSHERSMQAARTAAQLLKRREAAQRGGDSAAELVVGGAPAHQHARLSLSGCAAKSKASSTVSAQACHCPDTVTGNSEERAVAGGCLAGSAAPAGLIKPPWSVGAGVQVAQRRALRCVVLRGAGEGGGGAACRQRQRRAQQRERTSPAPPPQPCPRCGAALLADGHATQRAAGGAQRLPGARRRLLSVARRRIAAALNSIL